MPPMEEVYVTGTTRAQRGMPPYGVACLHLTQTPWGWRQRPIPPSSRLASDCMKVDYVCSESRDDVLDWLACDFVTKQVFKTAPAFS